jgi:soluble P-type ATPase
MRRSSKEHGVDASALAERADALRHDGATAIYIGIDGKAGGIFAIADPVKATTQEALNALHGEGIRIVMLTGDNKTTAEAVARQLGIDEVEADVLPDAKSAVVSRLKAEGRVVAMAGDGVNDAPALAAADVGIAMGSGTDVAIESAGVTLLKGDLMGIVKARRLSRRRWRISARICSSPSSTMPPASRLPQACFTLLSASSCHRSSRRPPCRCRRSASLPTRCDCGAETVTETLVRLTPWCRPRGCQSRQ